MAIEDKIKAAEPFSRRVFEIESLNFGATTENGGHFLTFKGRKVLEFNTLQTASDNATDLNTLINPKITTIRQAVRQQIQDILNA